MIALYFIAPLLVILTAQRVAILDKIGVVPLTFALGFAVALLAPAPLEGAQNVAEISVALALPLIIFATNMRQAIRDARGALTAILAGFASVVVVSIAASVVFAPSLARVDEVAGMSVGAYTGSGVNMGAIHAAIGGSNDLFLTMITYDIVFSVLYLAVVLLAGQRLAGLVLRPYAGDRSGSDGDMAHLADESARAYGVLIQRAHLPGLALVLAAAALIVGAGVGAGKILPEAGSVVVILVITTLGLAGSLVPALHRARASFHAGMYLILVFCFASAIQMDTRIFTQMDWVLGGYFLTVIFGAMALHAVLCRVFGIDRDTYLMASGASVMSVPFIPVIAGALKNRALLVPGIAIAVLGYAVGNYLGIGVAYAVRALI